MRHLGASKVVYDGAPGRSGGSPRDAFWGSPGLPIVFEVALCVTEVVRHGFIFCLNIFWRNLHASLSIADGMTFLFGVGGSGRSPVESADPEGPAWGEAWQGRWAKSCKKEWLWIVLYTGGAALVKVL